MEKAAKSPQKKNDNKKQKLGGYKGTKKAKRDQKNGNMCENVVKKDDKKWNLIKGVEKTTKKGLKNDKKN